jgi:hypothetical protein
VEDDGVGRALDNAKQSAPDATAQGQGKKTSLGLAITRSRLALLQQQYGGRASLRYEPVTCGTRAVVDMPLIPA